MFDRANGKVGKGPLAKAVAPHTIAPKAKAKAKAKAKTKAAAKAKASVSKSKPNSKPNSRLSSPKTVMKVQPTPRSPQTSKKSPKKCNPSAKNVTKTYLDKNLYTGCTLVTYYMIMWTHIHIYIVMYKSYTHI